MKPVRSYMLFLLFSLLSNIFAQIELPFGEIGKFKDANSFSINQAGFIYVTDITSNEVFKLDTLGNQLKYIGGYGWSESSFDHPSDVFANTLNVYVADKNNDRIQIFDKDLNFLSAFKTSSNDENYSFRYPTGIVVSNQGDLIILDSDNTRLLKFNLRGEFLFPIGGYDAGSYSLTNPKKFTIAGNQKIFVIDSKQIIVFDLFGNGITKIKLSFEPANINSTFRWLVLTDGQNIYYSDGNYSSKTIDLKTFSPQLDEEIKDAFVFNSKIYLLTKTTIFIYKFIE